MTMMAPRPVASPFKGEMSTVHSAPTEVRARIDQLYRAESRRVFASLVRLVRDFDLAEEVLHEAFAAAVERWPREGVPDNPRAWLVSAGRFKAVDALRRRGRLGALHPELAGRLAEVAAANAARAGQEIEDDRLRLVFACCHPAIDPAVQVPLTLREVCGLTTEEIAAAFLTAPAAMVGYFDDLSAAILSGDASDDRLNEIAEAHGMLVVGPVPEGYL